MITDALLGVLRGLLGALNLLLPEFTLPGFMAAGPIGDAFDTVEGWLSPFAYWIDLGTAFTAASAAITIRLSLFAYFVGVRVLDLIRGAG